VYTEFTLETAARLAWRHRVLRVGGIIQACFAAFWLVRGGLALGGTAGAVLALALGAAAIAALVYGVRATAGRARVPSGVEAKRLERSITIATVLELVAAFVFPVLVTAAGHADWVLPSIPFVLVVVLSGTALVVTTGLTAGALLFASAVTGFRDLAAEPVPVPA
jgi:hypothetical protein